MCKIFTMTNAKQVNVTDAVNRIGAKMLKIERDGFGYAVQGVKGVFGEKCVDISFSSRLKKPSKNPKEAIIMRYQTLGEYSKPDGPMLCHGRTSTNDHGLINCHPMIRDGHYLIHNGVVTDEGPKYEKMTSNDSEDCLKRFIDGIDSVEKYLTGYYAFCCISPDGRLHVVKDAIAELCIAWCEELDTYFLCTNAPLMREIAKLLKVKIGPIDVLKDDIYMIFNGNKLESIQSIESRGYGYREAQYASRSLGRTLESLESQDLDDDELDELGGLMEERDWEEQQYHMDRLFQSVDESFTIRFGDHRITAEAFHNLGYAEKSCCDLWDSDGNYIDLYKMRGA